MRRGKRRYKLDYTFIVMDKVRFLHKKMDDFVGLLRNRFDFHQCMVLRFTATQN